MIYPTMSKRLQVVVDDAEFDELQEVARREGMTTSEWVRRALRRARRDRTSGNPARKLAAIQAATRHSFPTGDIDQMVAEIEQGYGS
jgi:hypothetical protein